MNMAYFHSCYVTCDVTYLFYIHCYFCFLYILGISVVKRLTNVKAEYKSDENGNQDESILSNWSDNKPLFS